MMRRQPPVYSPLPLRGLLRCAVPREDAEASLLETLRSRFAVESALLCGSGTQALELAVRMTCDVEGRRRLVALPTFACYDLASAVVGADVSVVFYDIDPDTLCPDVPSLERALQHEPGAVVIAPLFGYQPDWDAIGALARAQGVTLIEDAAQSFGAAWQGAPAGGIGDISVLSFGRGKGWTAVEGGALLGSEAALRGARRWIASRGRGAGMTARVLLKGIAQWALARPTLYAIPSAMPGLRLGETVYHPPVPPRELGSISARLALETLGSSLWEAGLRRSRARAMAIRIAAQRSRAVRVPRLSPGSEPGSLRLPVLASPEARDHLVARGRAIGVMPGYPRPLPELPQLGLLMAEDPTYVGAKALAEGLVTLPTHSLLLESDKRRIFELLRDIDG